MESMLKHNIKTLSDVEFFTSQGKNCCVVNPCGSGKTSVMLGFIHNHPEASFLVLTKQKNAESYYKSKDPEFSDPRVKIVTYSKMHSDAKAGKLNGYEKDYFLVDEAHYLGAQLWSGDFQRLVNQYKPVLVGFTATPQRREDQGSDRDIVKDYFGGNYAGNFTASDLCKTNVFIEPEYVLACYALETIVNIQIDRVVDSELSEKIKTDLIKKLNVALSTWQETSTPEKIFKAYLPRFMYKPACNRILVYVDDMKSLPEKKRFIDECIAGVFPDKKIESYVYTYKSHESVMKEFLEEDNKTYVKIIYSIDKIMETIHIDDLRILVMLRPSVSKRIITQQFGRVNSIGNTNQPLIIDMVDNFSKLTVQSNPEQFKYKCFPPENVTENGSNQPAKPKREQVSLKIPHVSFYADIFAAVDKMIAKVPYYSYNGFTGTLIEFCKVFDLNRDVAEELISQSDISEVVSTAWSGKNLAPVGEPDMDEKYVLSPADADFAQRSISLLDRMFLRRKIEDEDLRQELYVQYYYAVAKSSVYAQSFARRVRIINDLNRCYIRKNRDRIREERMATNLTAMIPAEEESRSPMECIELYEVMADTMKTLAPREEKVLRLRFGFEDGKSHTLEEVGRAFGVTRERIREIEAKALRKMKHPARSKKLRDYLD